MGNSSNSVRPQLVVGLGNPEPKYDRTRHNIGFAAIDAIARVWHVSLSERRQFQGCLGEHVWQGHKIWLLKPLTYMNRSGQSIRAVVDWFKLSPAAVLVIYDDMDLPVGRIRLRQSGSAGGQNGMKSAIAHLGTEQFPRLRIGIGRPKPATDESISHVLGRFAPNEESAIAQVLDLVVQAVETSVRQGVEQAMNLYNNRAVELKGTTGSAGSA
jgi:PTH1 family peptidyl-tRNA hydrolase